MSLTELINGLTKALFTQNSGLNDETIVSARPTVLFVSWVCAENKARATFFFVLLLRIWFIRQSIECHSPHQKVSPTAVNQSRVFLSVWLNCTWSCEQQEKRGWLSLSSPSHVLWRRLKAGPLSPNLSSVTRENTQEHVRKGSTIDWLIKKSYP